MAVERTLARFAQISRAMDDAGEDATIGVPRRRKRYLLDPGVPIPKRTLLRCRQRRVEVDDDSELG